MCTGTSLTDAVMMSLSVGLMFLIVTKHDVSVDTRL